MIYDLLSEELKTTIHAQAYTVERVIDGDTLKLTNGEEVQLIDIKVPEDEKWNNIKGG